MSRPLILALVGSSGAGKTTLCLQMVELAKRQNVSVAGVLSLPVYREEHKVAISLLDVCTGDERVLARANDTAQGLRVGIWTFDTETLEWGQGVLRQTPTCNLLVIDEIGPLELEQQQGLTAALERLQRTDYHVALVPMRPSLATVLIARLEGLDATKILLVLDEQTRDLTRQIVRAGCLIWPREAITAGGSKPVGGVSTLIEQDREEPGNYRCQAEILRAMAHPLRLRLLAVLLEGPACVGELVERTGFRQPYVSQHLARLRETGLVEGIREGMTVRYHVICPKTDRLLAAVGMLDLPHTQPDEPKAS
jgi:ArsR family transcriptional regulator